VLLSVVARRHGESGAGAVGVADAGGGGAPADRSRMERYGARSWRRAGRRRAVRPPTHRDAGGAAAGCGRGELRRRLADLW